MLRKYIYGATYMIDYNDIKVNDDGTYQERPIQILDFGLRKLRRKYIYGATYMIDCHNIKVNDNATYQERPI